jgi:hypothetical protein
MMLEGNVAVIYRGGIGGAVSLTQSLQWVADKAN